MGHEHNQFKPFGVSTIVWCQHQCQPNNNTNKILLWKKWNRFCLIKMLKHKSVENIFFLRRKRIVEI